MVMVLCLVVYSQLKYNDNNMAGYQEMKIVFTAETEEITFDKDIEKWPSNFIDKDIEKITFKVDRQNIEKMTFKFIRTNDIT